MAVKKDLAYWLWMVIGVLAVLFCLVGILSLFITEVLMPLQKMGVF